MWMRMSPNCCKWEFLELLGATRVDNTGGMSSVSPSTCNREFSDEQSALMFIICLQAPFLNKFICPDPPKMTMKPMKCLGPIFPPRLSQTTEKRTESGAETHFAMFLTRKPSDSVSFSSKRTDYLEIDKFCLFWDRNSPRKGEDWSVPPITHDPLRQNNEQWIRQ